MSYFITEMEIEYKKEIKMRLKAKSGMFLRFLSLNFKILLLCGQAGRSRLVSSKYHQCSFLNLYSRPQTSSFCSNSPNGVVEERLKHTFPSPQLGTSVEALSTDELRCVEHALFLSRVV